VLDKERDMDDYEDLKHLLKDLKRDENNVSTGTAPLTLACLKRWIP